jgi:hypothetical protein
MFRQTENELSQPGKEKLAVKAEKLQALPVQEIFLKFAPSLD